MSDRSSADAAPRILLIEDDEATLYVFRKRLTDIGYVVDCAPNALHGMQFLADHTYAAVLLDLVMPGPMNGFAIISFIETEYPDVLDRLVIISGMPEQTVMHAAPALLPRFYRKPFDIDVVVAAVGALSHRDEVDETDGKRILLADDDAEVRRLLEYVVRNLGREPLAVADGHAAIRHLATSNFAGVVVDLLMPSVDGYGVLRYLREERPAMLPRTIVLTGMPAKLLENPLLVGACAVVEKPVDPEVLQRVLERCAAAGGAQ